MPELIETNMQLWNHLRDAVFDSCTDMKIGRVSIKTSSMTCPLRFVCKLQPNLCRMYAQRCDQQDATTTGCVLGCCVAGRWVDTFILHSCRMPGAILLGFCLQQIRLLALVETLRIVFPHPLPPTTFPLQAQR